VTYGCKTQESKEKEDDEKEKEIVAFSLD